MNRRRCPHPECKQQIMPHMYACKQHWFSLPQGIRDKIWAAYQGHGDYELAHEEAQAHWLKPSSRMVKQSIIELLRAAQMDYDGAVNPDTGEELGGFPQLISRISALLEKLP